MGKRVTVVLDDELVKKLHEIQAKLIRESESSVSFSRVLNEQVRNSLKK
jgi:predicted transcriptional regulator